MRKVLALGAAILFVGFCGCVNRSGALAVEPIRHGCGRRSWRCVGVEHSRDHL